jgi:hypothetical protein
VLFVSISERAVLNILSGGMIAFVVENHRVRFGINETAAETAGLKLSSKLLSVARSVEK